MGISYQIDKDQALVISRGFGLIENDDLLMHNHKLKTDPMFSTHFNQIIDLTDVKINHLNKNIVKEVINISPFSTHSLMAIVAPQDREFEFINNIHIDNPGFSVTIRAFRQKEEARKWVNRVKVKILPIQNVKEAI